MSRLKRTLAIALPVQLLSLALVLRGEAGGLPTHGTVAAGNAAIVSPAPNQLVVNQSSETALINWNSFSVSSGSAVTFNQPNAGALTVNRVTGPQSSVIDGSLTANGNLWLINENGILFGQGSEVNVGALLATTSDISDDDFRAGKYAFTKASPNASASVVNQGTIDAANGGYVALSGSNVANSGLIRANLGSVVLGGGDAFVVDITGDHLLSYEISAPKDGSGGSRSLVSNAGTIVANGGHVLLTARAARNIQDNVINNTGIVEATAVSSQNGEIVLDAGDGGTVNDSGRLDASGTGSGQTGGTVAITGNTVNVKDGATIDASGDRGGGTIEIGGGPHGRGALAHAQTTNVADATIKADALEAGNGGSITIWSDNSTVFSGSASAQGGSHGGNGGTIETSGAKLQVTSQARVSTLAPEGKTGDWLLDPTDITIKAGGTDGVGCASASCLIAPSTITDALGSTNVSLEATDDITVDTFGTYSSTNTLTLLAGNNIIVDANIQNSSSGAINLIAGWDGTTATLGSLTNAGVYGNNHGSADINAVSVGSDTGVTTVAGYDVVVAAGGSTSASIGYLGGGAGNINVLATDDVTLTGSVGGCSCSAQIGNGGVFVAGNKSGNIAVVAGNDVSLTGGDSVYSFAQIGNGGDSSTGSASGTISVVAGGSISLEGESDYAQIGNGGYGTGITGTSGNIIVQATGGITLTGRSTYGYAQIGNGGQSSSSTDGGNISVTAGGPLALTSGGSLDFALIGNGDGDQSSANSATGNISVQVAGTTTFDNSAGSSVWLGNRTGGTESGNVTFITGQLSQAGTFNFDQLIETNLGTASAAGSGGNVTVGTTGQAFTLGAQLNYSSPNALALLSTSDMTIGASIQNTGAGGVTLVAGWDGATPVSQLQSTANAFGQNGARLVLGGGGASGGVAVGSNGGATTILTDNLGLQATNGYAQLGYHGAGGGNIDVDAVGALTETGGASQIGNGASFGSTTAAGAIDVTAQSMTPFDEFTIAGSTADIVLTGAGNAIGSSSVPLAVTVNALGLGTNNGNAYINAPQGLSIGANSQGIALGTGSLSLTTSGTIAQTQPISANAVTITATSGDVDLTNANNTISEATLSAAGNISLADSAALTITGANTGSSGTLVLVDTGGGINASGGAIIASQLTGSSAGDANFTNSANGIGTLDAFRAGGNFGLVDSQTLNVSGADVASLGITGVTSGYGNSTGNLSLTTTGAHNDLVLASSLRAGSASGTQTVTLTSGGGISQSTSSGQSITSGTLSASASDGNISLANAGDAFATATIRSSGNATITDSAALTIDGASVNGVLSLTSTGLSEGSGNANAIAAASLSATALSGDIDLPNGQNQIGAATVSTPGNLTLYDAANLTIINPSIGGSATLLTTQNLTFDSSLQVSGMLVAVAGWDGVSTTQAALAATGAYGNHDGSIVVDGAGASGNVAVGGASGTMTVEGANISLDAENGFAQLGMPGAASESISIAATGNVSLSGGAQNGDFAQIGNGGLLTTGNESGNIAITAGGNIALDAGAGSEAYAQIGHGGAQSNSHSSGYSDTGTIAATGNIVTLAAGAGTGSYAQIGNGGYESGQFLDGQATLGGTITVDGVSAVTLQGGGNSAYAQIGNGGAFVNSQPASGSGGTISGAIVVAVSTPMANKNAVSLTAGPGSGAYVQIGDGGLGENAPGSGANFTVGGNIEVDDLILLGSNSGTLGYAQIGNGDAAQQGVGNVGGNITIGSGASIVLTDGLAQNAIALIGNATGNGTVTGTVTGYVLPGQTGVNTNGAIAAVEQASGNPGEIDVELPSGGSESLLGFTSNGNGPAGSAPTPLDVLVGSPGAGTEGGKSSDVVAQLVGQSLDPGSRKVFIQTQSLIPGVLTEVFLPDSFLPDAVPPADEDYSSWGNEALWQ